MNEQLKFSYVYILVPVIQFAGVSQSVSSSSCTHETTVTEGEDEMVSVMVERIGDSSKEVSVMCTAHEVSASSSQDYQERVKKRVTFAPGQTKAYCNVTILDDDEFEPRESFKLKLDRPRILAVTNSSADTLCVYIEEDEKDRKLCKFSVKRSHTQIHFDEMYVLIYSRNCLMIQNSSHKMSEL